MSEVVLDVRPFHERGEEPFSAIMSAVETLPAGAEFHLINSFVPTPLFRVMERRGFRHRCEHVGSDEIHVFFSRDS